MTKLLVPVLARRYAYDFPTVFGNALREVWTARAIAGEPGSVPKGARPAVAPACALKSCYPS